MNSKILQQLAVLAILPESIAGGRLVIHRDGHDEQQLVAEQNAVHHLRPGDSIRIQFVPAELASTDSTALDAQRSADAQGQAHALDAGTGQSLSEGLANAAGDQADPPAASGPTATTVADNGVTATSTTGAGAESATAASSGATRTTTRPAKGG